jgi:hypothetical protein
MCEVGNGSADMYACLLVSEAKLQEEEEEEEDYEVMIKKTML